MRWKKNCTSAVAVLLCWMATMCGMGCVLTWVFPAMTAKLMTEAGVITLTAFISPFRDDRARARSLFPHGDFLEIYCRASLDVCEARDVKGFYKKARAGEIKNYTGIDSPYEAPLSPELVVDTGVLPLDVCVAQVLALLTERGAIKDA
jgi:adenylylsulfate kinase